MDATLSLLRWRQTRRGYDQDDELLSTAFQLLAPDASGAFGADCRLRQTESKYNIPADRIATELIHLALLLITKPRHDDTTQSRRVLQLLHLGLKALRGTAPATAGGLAIPLNACNLLLAAMAETLEHRALDDDAAVVDVLQIFVFLFGIDDADATPSFHMYKPPTNVFSSFLLRAASAIFTQLQGPLTESTEHLVALVIAMFRVFQELQNSQVNKKKVFLAIAKTSFRDIVGFRHALVALESSVNGISMCREILDQIILDALFDSEHLRAYDSALSHIGMWQTIKDQDKPASHKPKKQRKNKTNGDGDAASSLVSYQRHVFDELEAFLKDSTVNDELKASIGSLLELLVSGFSMRIRAAANDKIEDTRADIKSTKKRVANVIATTSTTYSPFKFWAELCGVTFRALDGHAAVSMLVRVYDSLFAALCDADVYRVTEDTEELELFGMMQTILSRFLDQLQDVETQVEAPTMERVCSVVSNAVRCTPNLVNSSLLAILQVLGVCSLVVDAASAAMVELLHAYESMRLVDAFLRTCCATDDDDSTVATGLLAIFSTPTTEATLRRTYMTLPPGQLEIVWRLLSDKLAGLCGSGQANAVAAKMALVRSLLAVFLQEIHITPQNRAKIGELVKDSHEKLLAPLAGRITRFKTPTKKKSTDKSAFSVVERELFSVFGEFLALYDGLAPAGRSETLDVVLGALDSKLVPVMTSLLAGNDDLIVGAAAGIVKVGVHRLRRKTTETDNVASLIVDRVILWQCWDAVAFYLPELVEGLDDDKAVALYTKLVESFLSTNESAERILRDAAFYEIATLQRVAPQVFSTIISREAFVADHTAVRRLFDHLLGIPVAYMDVTASTSSDLLVAVLHVHQTIAKNKSSGVTDTIARFTLWIERYLVSITSENSVAKVHKDVLKWIEFLLLDAVTFDGSSHRLVTVAVAYYVAADDHIHMDKTLSKLLAQKTARGYATCATVLGAMANLQSKHSSTASKFVDSLLSLIETTPSIVGSLDSDASFQLLTAVVRYAASLPETASASHKLAKLLETHVSQALATAMQTIVHTSTATSGSRYAFFAAFCETFHLLRPAVTLETYGCLLAVALVLASDESDRPLHCLVQHANKDEFRLLVSTLQRELVVPSSSRVTAALKAMVLILETDRKLSNARRQVLSECKADIVGLLTQRLSRALVDVEATALSVWALRVFVLLYCKAELFTWKPHELLHVFTGFQPLTVVAAGASGWTPAQIHDVWLLSYNLLLRIVRHHFASLIHGIPHMIDALNALLRVLVASSSRPEMAAYTLEWSSNLARLYGYLKPQDAALRKHVVYVLLTYLRGVTQGKLSLALQHKLRPGIFALLEMCSLFEKEQLYASLDATGKSLLKSLDTSYKLTYRYAGKV